ncbi:MAG: putative DNA binding domain-containing protein [Firmicutes bacterium]|nr:putative DNA binding domain-containing protein [Bacillota bacterium]
MESLSTYLMAEATEYEFKSALDTVKPKSWLKTVSAFANGIGGSIYFGVDDDTAKVIGIKDTKSVITKISEIIKERIEPSVSFALEPLAVDGVDVLRLNVPSGMSTPYYYVGDGNRIAYYRLGNQSVPANSHILMELTLKGQNQSFDALDSRLRPADYSFTLFDATYLRRTGHRIDKTKDYISFGLIKNDSLTNAGALFADESPIYNSRIVCTRWNGLGKTSLFEALNDANYQGNIITIFGNALDFVRNNSHKRWHKTRRGGHVDYYDYPEVAVFEAVVNAIVHRSYLIKGSEIHIDMYDDRLEIVSPGDTVDGKRIQDLKIENVPSVRRNPILCEIMQRLKYMEGRGSGLTKIVKAYPADVVPQFESTPQVFITRLKNLNYGKPLEVPEEDVPENVTINGADVTINGTINGTIKLNATEKRILELLAVNGDLSREELAGLVGKDLRTVQRGLNRLRDNGLIIRDGSKKTGSWVVKK